MRRGLCWILNYEDKNRENQNHFLKLVHSHIKCQNYATTFVAIFFFFFKLLQNKTFQAATISKNTSEILEGLENSLEL